LYVANDSLGELLKYTLVSGSWTASGTITAAGVHGVTGVVSGTTVTLYASGTTGTDGTLYSFTDSTGYDGTVSGAASMMATAAANEAFRGVALAPVGSAPTPTSTVAGTSTQTPAITNAPTQTASVTNTPTRPLIATSTPTETPTGTPTPTATASDTPTSTPTASPTPTVVCIGDCDGSGTVTIDEIISLVNFALGNAPVLDCPAADTTQAGQTLVSQILAAVNNAFTSCPTN